MRYCVSSRHQPKTLALADEIYVDSPDIDILTEYMVKYPNKTFIYNAPSYTDGLKKYMGIDNLIFEIHTLKEVDDFANQGLHWMWKYPVTTYMELITIVSMHPSYIRLGAPLSFDLPSVFKAAKGVPLRLIANYASESYLLGKLGYFGTFVRPEDVSTYEEYIDVLEFNEPDLAKEARYLHIYKENGEWPGNLKLLIPNLPTACIDNKLLPQDWAEVRSQCGQRCLRSGNCHYCDTGMLFAKTLRDSYFDPEHPTLQSAT